MFTQLQRGERREGMRVFARTHHHCIEFLRMIKDAAEIRVSAGFCVLFSRFIQIVGVHIAERRDMFR